MDLERTISTMIHSWAINEMNEVARLRKGEMRLQPYQASLSRLTTKIIEVTEKAVLDPEEPRYEE